MTMETEYVPDDVRALVIAARAVAFDSNPSSDALRFLDAASEAFASRVPWDDEPSADPDGSNVVVTITGVDKWGPMLEWRTPWTELPIGTQLYALAPKPKVEERV